MHYARLATAARASYNFNVRGKLETVFFDLPKPRVFAHRGASGDFPENTMPAFQSACDRGAPYIELDIHMTSDGEIVVFHDPDLKRTTEHNGILKDLSMRELQALDAGYNFARDGGHPFRASGITIPTLREVLATFSGAMFVVEIKQTDPSLVGVMLDVIRATSMKRRVLIASEHQAPLEEVRRLAPELPTNFSAIEVADLVRALHAGVDTYTPAGDALQIPPEYQGIPLATPEAVSFAHSHGVEVHVWTINDEAQMHELLQMGVDGIMSDYPRQLLEVAAASRQG